MSDYYKQYVTYADAHDKRDGTRPMYREYLEGQLAIAEARIAELETELATASKGWAESNRVWDEKRVEAHRLGAELEAEQADNERLREKLVALETEVSVYRVMYSPSVNVAARYNLNVDPNGE